MSIIEVVADHHLENLKELAIGDESVGVNVIDLEGKTQLLLGAGTGRERVKTLNKFEERDIAVIVAIKDCDDPPD